MLLTFLAKFRDGKTVQQMSGQPGAGVADATVVPCLLSTEIQVINLTFSTLILGAFMLGRVLIFHYQSMTDFHYGWSIDIIHVCLFSVQYVKLSYSKQKSKSLT